MSIVQLLNDAGNAINRFIQQLEEKFFDTEKTEFDDEYAGNLKKLETLMHFTEVLIDDTESMLEPNPAYRLEGKLMEKVERRNDRPTPLENLGAAFESASIDVKQFNYELYKDFALCSKYQIKLGIASKEFQNTATEIYVSKLKKMLNVDLNKYKEEADILENLRLDYDSLRIRIKKAITVVGKEMLEKEFEEVKRVFLRKIEYNMSYFTNIDEFFEVHRNLLKEFVESQSKYYKDCYNDLEKFKSKMETRNMYSLNGLESGIYSDGHPSITKKTIYSQSRIEPHLPMKIIPENVSGEINVHSTDPKDSDTSVLIKGHVNVNGVDNCGANPEQKSSVDVSVKVGFHENDNFLNLESLPQFDEPIGNGHSENPLPGDVIASENQSDEMSLFEDEKDKSNETGIEVKNIDSPLKVTLPLETIVPEKDDILKDNNKEETTERTNEGT